MTIQDSYNRVFNLTGLHATQLVTDRIANLYHEYNARGAGKMRNTFYKKLITALKARIEELGAKATYLGSDFNIVREALFYLIKEVGAEELQVEEEMRLALLETNEVIRTAKTRTIGRLCFILGIENSAADWLLKYPSAGDNY